MYVQYCRILVLRDSVATILGYDTGYETHARILLCDDTLVW